MSLGTKEQQRALDNVISEFKKNKYTIVRVLEETQKIYGYLPESVMNYISNETQIPESEIYSIATFYAEFSFQPKGEFPVSVCMGTACYVNGADKVLDKIISVLKCRPGECTADGKFSIDQTRCVGCCGMAPVMSVGEDIYGNVKIESVESILNKYMEKNL